MSQSKLTKVTLEYENGVVKSLSGDDAEKWMAAINSYIQLQTVRSNFKNQFPQFEWEIESPAKEPG